MRVELTVPEQAVSLVKVGSRCGSTVDAYPGEVHRQVVRISLARGGSARAHGRGHRGERRRRG